MFNHPIIQPSRVQHPTTSMILASCISADLVSRQPAPETNVLAHSVECTNPESPPGQRNWIVRFSYEDSSANSYDGKNWSARTQVTQA